MKTREFLETLTELVRQQLPPELSGVQVTRRITSLVKFYYDRPTVHYEVWVQGRSNQVELGLHFEGDPEANFRSLELLARHAVEIRQALGRALAIEQWDKGWTRAHETLPLEPLDDDFLVEVSFKLAGMIRALEPILRAQAQV